MANREDWLRYRLAVEVARLYGQNSVRNIPVISTGRRIATRDVQRFRALSTLFGRAEHKPYTTKAQMETKDAIFGIFSKTSPRSSFSIAVGDGKYMRKAGRANFRVSVGYMWIKRVFPIYKSGWTDQYPDWFILEATPVKSNIRDAVLYAAKMTNQKTNQTESRYIAQSMANKKAIGQGKTPAIARAQMEKAMVELFTKGIGENHDQST